MRKYIITVIISFLLVLSCNNDLAFNRLADIEIASLSQKQFNWNSIKEDSIIVFFFLAPDCPMCINYALPMSTLHKEYNKKGISFFGVYPGNFYTNEEILFYVKKYNLSFPMLLDVNFQITKLVNATITPEVFVLNKNEAILYEGKIDDWAVSLGQWKQNISEYYLADALDAILANENIMIEKTEAVGCFIEDYE